MSGTSFFNLVELLQQQIDLLSGLLSGSETESVIIDGQERATIAKSIKDNFSSLQTMVQGRIPFQSRAALLASSPPEPDGLAEVWNDDVVENNGLYIYSEGTWAKSKYDMTALSKKVIETNLSSSTEALNLYDDPEHWNPEKYWPTLGKFSVVEISGRRRLKLKGSEADFGKELKPEYFPSGKLSVSVRVESKQAATSDTSSSVIYLLQYSTPADRAPLGGDEIERDEFIFPSSAISEATTVLFSDIEIKEETNQIRLYWRTSDGADLIISEVCIKDGSNPFYSKNYELKSSPSLGLLDMPKVGKAVLTDTDFKGLNVNSESSRAMYSNKVGVSSLSSFINLSGYHKILSANESLLSHGQYVKECPDTAKGESFIPLIVNNLYFPPLKIDDYLSFKKPSTLVSAWEKIEISEPRYHKLPIAAGSASPYEGFVCTGLDRDSDGYWIVGNDGRGEGAADCSSVVVLSHDFSTVIKEYLVRGPGGLASQSWGSVQGVAWDSTDNTIWATDKTGSEIIHINRDNGNLLPDSISLPFPPNGIAYDRKLNALWVAEEGRTKVHLYNCETGTLVKTLPMRSNADQLHLDQENRILYCSSGSNGSAGEIYGIDIENVRSVFIDYGDQPISGSESIEGIYFTDDKLFVMNDGGFHTEARPPLNRVLEYAVKNKPKAYFSRRVGISLVYRNPLQNTSSVCLASNGDPLDSGGWGFYLSQNNPNELRFIASDTGNDSLVIDAMPVENSAAWNCVSMHVDLDSGEFTSIVNGQENTPQTISGDLSSALKDIDLKKIRVGSTGTRVISSTRRFEGDIAHLILFEDVENLAKANAFQMELLMTSVINE